ncbi:C3orf38 family protein [Megaselia abdita]
MKSSIRLFQVNIQLLEESFNKKYLILDSLDTIFLYTQDSQTLLNKKMITKEVLFKYLHSNRRVIKNEVTKINLILEILRFWKESFSETKVSEAPQLIDEEQFPINLLARTFTEWFFKNFNENTLKNEDFFADAGLEIRTKANDGEDEQNTSTPEDIINTMYSIRNKIGVFFNPNVTHMGVQGRMSPHGSTLVLGCGTLHTDICVGVFESGFEIIRDPFSNNNWKIKTIKMQLKSSSSVNSYALEESETLKDALTLPVTHQSID